MKLIAEQSYRRFLVELDEDEAAELEGTDVAKDIVRAEGAGNRPRMWVDEEDLLGLVDAACGEEAGKDFRAMLVHQFNVKAN